MLPYKMDIHEKISILSECSLLIGMRLHALILSAVANTPMVGISYDPKIDSFLQQVNQPIIGNVDGDWTPETLHSMAIKQLGQTEYVQETLGQRVEELREQISIASKYIINDLHAKESIKRGMELQVEAIPLLIQCSMHQIKEIEGNFLSLSPFFVFEGRD